MFALFHGNVARGPPELLSSAATSAGGCKLSTGAELLAHFLSTYGGTVVMQIEDQESLLAYTHQKQLHILSPRAFAANEDIMCVFEGGLENLARCRERYGLSKSVTEALLAIEVYRALRDRAPYPAHQVLRDLHGAFAFVIYDHHAHKIFVAVDADEKVPLFWGATADGSIAFSDDESLIRLHCGSSFAAFPPGCYFSSDEGLRSFEHPLKAMKVVPQLDSQGIATGAVFMVDQTCSGVSGTRVM